MTVTTPTGDRAGTAYFVPGVRIRKLSPNVADGLEVGDDLPADVAAEVLKVEITRVNTGASQFTITFNNWYTTTDRDRAGPESGNREIGGRDRPLWPRFKHNAFDLIGFGDRLRIDLRYWPETSSGETGAAVTAREWVPMIAGPVTDMRFDFGPEGSTVVVTGEDDLSRLKDRPSRRREFGRVAEQDLVRQVLALAEYPLQLADSQLDWPPFATGTQAPAEALGDNQSYLDYLQKLADKFDFEVFVEFADLDDANAGVAFHFEPARCRLPPDRANADLYRLSRDKNLITFSPVIKVLDMPTGVRVTGRHMDARRAERVEGAADPDVLRDEIFIDPDRDGDVATGPAVRQRFFPERENPLNLINTPNLDSDRGRQQAETLMRRKAREFMVIEATTIGLPRLRPGTHVEIRGMRPPFDGYFYVTRTVHTVGADGLRTKLTARRPGMPLPPYDEA